MNTVEVLRNGHHVLWEAFDGLRPAEWETPGAVGAWSIKDTFAHLTTYELLLVDLLNMLLHTGRQTPTLDQYRDQYALAFDEQEVVKRREMTLAELFDEYETAHTKGIRLFLQIPVSLRCEAGIAPWEGSPYDLEDFILYSIYGHKREHSAQIVTFRQHLSHPQPNGSTRNGATQWSRMKRWNLETLRERSVVGIRFGLN